MSDAPAAITASLVDVRNLNTEKSVKLTLHVPAELAEAVFAAFGWPTSTNPVPVALARLNLDVSPVAKPEPPKERRPFSELPYAQQAAMRCQEPAFHRFLTEVYEAVFAGRPLFASASEAATYGARALCRVSSRSEIVSGTTAGNRWASLEAEFYAWSRGYNHGR